MPGLANALKLLYGARLEWVSVCVGVQAVAAFSIKVFAYLVVWWTRAAVHECLASLVREYCALDYLKDH